MVQLGLGTKRTALALYGVLLVLPTLVLGGLLWSQLVLDHQLMLNTVPGDANNATGRLGSSLEHQLEAVMRPEQEREFFEYRPNYFPAGTIGTDLALVPSPLRRGPTAPEIVGWYSFKRNDVKRGRPPIVLLGSRSSDPEAESLRNQLLVMTLDLQARLGKMWEADTHVPTNVEVGRLLLGALGVRPRPDGEGRGGNRVGDVKLPLTLLAINLSEEESIDCMRDDLPELRGLEKQSQSVHVGAFHLSFYRDALGTPRLVARRSIYIPRNTQLGRMSGCFDALGRETRIEQGFFIDPQWFFHDLPAAAAESTLEKGSQVFIPMDAVHDPSDIEGYAIAPLRQLGIEVFDPSDLEYGTMKVAVNMRDLERGFRTQTVRFLGVAAMLVVSLGTGLVLLLRSVNRDLETARRTENFIAAVTHELRTPVASIKLYGEMLDDGWVDDDPAKRKEYYRRIVRETGRLETLVENVLEKSQIARREAEPEPGDLNAVIESMETSLKNLAQDGVMDLEFVYGEGLPQVMLVPEGVRSIVTNLVENARKYAPMKRDVAVAEPIIVMTHALAGMPVLDVMDRGPGIPHAERTKIFQAFYRVGNEETRTARGTGLGLHLVMLQTTLMRARVGVLDRKGGGTVFRVTFVEAPTYES